MTDKTTGRPIAGAMLIALLFGTACGRDKPAAHDSGAASTTGAEQEHATAGGEESEKVPSNRVTLSEAAAKTADVAVEPVRAEATGAAGGGLEVPGQVDYDPARVALVSPRTAGRIERLSAVEGERVGAGQTMALLTSPAFLTGQSDLQQAVRRAGVLRGTPDAEGADALVAAARRRLRTLGVGDVAIGRLEAGGEATTFLAIPAPFDGTVIEAMALAGAAVESGTPLFRIADLSVVDVTAQVPERALPLLRIGQRATVTIAAYPSLAFTGHVERVKAQLDPATRTASAVLHVSNTGRALRPGMFAAVRLDVPLGDAVASSRESAEAVSPRTVLTIPESAIVTDGELRYAFVEVGPRTYERREVRVVSVAPAGSGATANERVAVQSGLSAGERVVVRGAFTLKSELAKASFAEED